ncbi:receptor protein kinase TMK1 [Brachypodium distachyon]|uniref:receptor protein kinase TMK1 n=1 Tax=Brachypodium distachyon TaxID=15368 RepID=UPI0001C751A9|nr:receptor protein kinase TMK1 [Brachypodium distachyon]|eukprot:XP_003559550.1 receptor protein kinase TMK1 [Brachypodium distachyon]
MNKMKMPLALLSFLLLAVASTIPAAAGILADAPSAASTAYGPDDFNMHAVATALGADRALGWRNDSSACRDGWTGITCGEGGKVIAIRARNAGLNGTLPTEVTLLFALQVLDLRDNGLTGALPDAVFLELTNLHIDNNLFTSVPADFLSTARSLQGFSISNNTQLQPWELLHDAHRLTKLRHFIANNAGVSGTLSGFLGNRSVFPELSILSLAHNLLTGHVPATFYSRTLHRLDLSSNDLSGPIDFIANLLGLEELLLDHNSFTGPMPDLSGLWKLQVVDVAHNRLTGVVPASLTDLGLLNSVSLTGNLFQGPLPELASSVHSDITNAAFNGSFCRTEHGPCDPLVDAFIAIAGGFQYPEALAASWKGNHPCAGWLGVNCDDGGVITEVNLCRLGLNGTLHPAFGTLKTIQALLLAGNNISGAVPQSIAELPLLRFQDVSDNSLEGSMPRFHSGVSIWAQGNPNLTVPAASCTPCIYSDTVRGFLVAAALTVIVALISVN